MEDKFIIDNGTTCSPAWQRVLFTAAYRLRCEPAEAAGVDFAAEELEPKRPHCSCRSSSASIRSRDWDPKPRSGPRLLSQWKRSSRSSHWECCCPNSLGLLPFKFLTLLFVPGSPGPEIHTQYPQVQGGASHPADIPRLARAVLLHPEDSAAVGVPDRAENRADEDRLSLEA